MKLFSRGFRLLLWLWFIRKCVFFVASDVWYAMYCYLLPTCETWQERLEALVIGAYLLAWQHRVIPHRILRAFDRTVFVTCGGLRFWIRLTSGEHGPLAEIFGGRIYTRIAGFIPQHGQIVVDVGANIGGYSLMAAQRGARVLAIEAQKDVFDRLHHSIQANRACGEVIAIPAAVGADFGRGHMERIDSTTCSRWIQADPDSFVPWEQRVYPLDHLTSKHKFRDHVDILKIDTEGSEYGILQGAEQTLMVTERVVMEYHSPVLLANCHDLLSRYGFTLVYDLNPHHINLGIAYFERREQE